MSQYTTGISLPSGHESSSFLRLFVYINISAVVAHRAQDAATVTRGEIRGRRQEEHLPRVSGSNLASPSSDIASKMFN